MTGLYNEAVAWFSQKMLEKLKANAHKGHWANCDNGYLRRRMRTETRELFDLLDKSRDREMTREMAARIAAEAADIANFALMIADNAHRAASSKLGA